MSRTYRYFIPHDFPSLVEDDVDPGTLRAAIDAEPGITKALSPRGVWVQNAAPAQCFVEFLEDLPADQLVLLDGNTRTDPVGPPSLGDPIPTLPATAGIIGAHTGTPPEDLPELVRQAGPSEEDGRPVYSPYPATFTFGTFITGCGDNLSPVPGTSGRGQGTSIYASWDGTEETIEERTKTIDLDLIECVQIADGHADYKPSEQFSGKDSMSLGIVIPASTPPLGGDLNLREEDLSADHPMYTTSLYLQSLGSPPIKRYRLVTPGTGTHTVALSAMNEIESFDNLSPADVRRVTTEKDFTQSGLWDVDRITGNVRVADKDECGGYDFLSIELNPEFIRNCPLGSHPGEFDIEVARAEWLHRSWKIRIKIVKDRTLWGRYSENGSPGPCEFSGFITCYRALRG